jgi:Xaa-Pro aminopeptidase
MIVKEVDTPDRFGDRPYYGFEHITMVPMNQKLIDVGLLDDKEKAWVNLYHMEVWDKISSKLEERGLAWKWLKRECAAI